MKRNCYLDLRFHPSSSPPLDSMNELWSMNKKVVSVLHSTSTNRQYMHDVTEFKVRVIIWLASQESEGSKGSAASGTSLSLQSQALLMHAAHGFSVERSLRNFLHKRKKRSQQSHRH